MIRLRRCGAFGFLALCCIGAPAHAQETYDNPRPVTTPLGTYSPANTLAFGFDKSFNTYHWNATGHYDENISPVWIS
ncbi:MAG TPA: hypothetical protein VKS81_12120, partial [Bacteroidota bacterium]|nr:hypothetical protein [Bacteroidota bacterium]